MTAKLRNPGQARSDDDVRIPFLDDVGFVKKEELRSSVFGEQQLMFRPKRAENQACCRFDKEHVVLILMVVSVTLGITLGVILRATEWKPTATELVLLNFPGELFLRMLNLLILPLIVSTLVNSLAGLQAKAAGRLGLLTAVFYVTTTGLAIAEGIVLVEMIRPGDRFGTSESLSDLENKIQADDCNSTVLHSLLDVASYGAIANQNVLSRNLVPENLVDTAIRSTRTCVDYTDVAQAPPSESAKSAGKISSNPPPVEKLAVTAINVGQVDGMNALGLVVIAIAFGLTIARMGKKGRPLAEFFAAFELLTMKLIFAVIWFAPVGITFLIATQIVKMDDPIKQLEGLGLYVATVLTGLALHGFILLPMIYVVLMRRNPLVHYKGASKAFIAAVGTDSSSAAIPVSVKCCEELGCDSRVARFVMPLGASLNMSGSALYEAIAALYIAQIAAPGYDLGKKILISLTATLVSVAGANIPSAGSITMLMAMNAAGLPAEYAAWVIPADWFLDRIRTGFTVLGDTVCAAFVTKYSRKQLSRPSITYDANGVTATICDEVKGEVDLHGVVIVPLGRPPKEVDHINCHIHNPKDTKPLNHCFVTSL